MVNNKLWTSAIFVIVLGVNLLCASPKLVPSLYPDSGSYQGVADQISNHQKLYLEVRTPGYPFFLSIVEKLFTPKGIVIIQSLFAALAAVVLLRLLVFVIHSAKWSAVWTIVFMTEYGVTSWQGIVLTESLSISLLIFWLYAQLVTIKIIPNRFQKFFPLVALGLDISLIMLRPAFVYLPVLWYLGLIFLKFLKIPQAFPIRKIIISLTIVLLFILGYSGMIEARYGHFELTMVSRLNRLGNIIKLGLVNPRVCQEKSCTPMQQRAVQLSATRETADPYLMLNQLLNEYPNNNMDQILDSTLAVMNPPTGNLELHALPRFGYIFFEPIWFDFQFHNNWFNPNGFLLRDLLYRIYTRAAELLMILRPLAVIWIVWVTWKNFKIKQVSLEAWVQYIFLFLVVYNAGVSVFGGYADYKRLMSSVVVEMNALVIFSIVNIKNNIDQNRQTTPI